VQNEKKIVGYGILLWMMGSTLATTAQTPAPAPAETKTCIGSANKAKIEAYVMLLRLRGDLLAKWKETGVWPADAETDKALEAHAEYWAKQLKGGRAILAGGMNGDYWDNVALIIFQATSMEEAEALAKNDPAVKAYAFQAQIRPFDLFWLTNKFQPGVEACAEVETPPAK
jgi:uncharacterized protein YciI